MKVTLRFALAAVLFNLTAQIILADSGSWLGTVDGHWDKNDNWSGTVRPYGSDTATFNGPGNGNTTIRFWKLQDKSLAIKYVVFDSADCASYKVATSLDPAFWMISGGSITINADVIQDQRIGQYISLGNTTGSHTIYFKNFSPFAKFIAEGDLKYRSTAADLVTLQFEGVGAMEFQGDCITNGVASSLVKNLNSGNIKLLGKNHINRWYNMYQLGDDAATTHITIANGGELFLDNGNSSSVYTIWQEGDGLIDGEGTLRLGAGPDDEYAQIYIRTGSTLTIRTPLTGIGGLEKYFDYGGGTLVLDCVNTVPLDLINSSPGFVSVAKIGNQGALDSNVGCGERIAMVTAGAGLRYTGIGETTDRLIEFSRSCTIDHAGSGDLVFSEDFIVGANTKTLTLSVSTNGTGAIDGVISAGTGTTSLTKDGGGEWRLSANNTYGGATTLKSGTLKLYGADGALSATSALTSEGATLTITNSVAANNSNRINDSAPVTLQGGGIEFVHDSAVDTDYSETFGALTVADYPVVIKLSQAAEGQSSTLIFDSLTVSGNVKVNFEAPGLGAEDNERARIYFTSPPTTVDGYLGAWATVNGNALAMYDETRGVYPSPTVNIAARGPDSVIPDDPTVNVWINAAGVDGPVTLAGENGAGVLSLSQMSSTPSTVTLANKTLSTGTVIVNTDAADLTLGQSPGEGLLQNLAGFSRLNLENRSESQMTVNAIVTESAAGTGLIKSGLGSAALNGSIYLTGTITVNNGLLSIGNSSATPNLIGNFVEITGGADSPTMLEINGASDISEIGEISIGLNSGDRSIMRVNDDLNLAAVDKSNAGKIKVGLVQNVSGAVYQRSGAITVSPGVWTTTYYLGNSSGYGYHHMTGGSLRAGQMAVGGGSSTGSGTSSAMDVFGGEVTFDAWCLIISWGKCVGAVNVFDGSVSGGESAGREIILCYNANQNSVAQLNLLGDNARIFDRGSASRKLIDVARGDGNLLGVVNLNAGELTLYQAYAKSTTTPAHFNFNGGLLKASQNSDTFLQDITAAYVCAGGARIDTDGCDAEIKQPLVAPEGYGLSAIELTGGGAGYIGAPVVIVSGGSGVGAAAIALVDVEDHSPTCGQVTNVMVTSAGSGYQESDTLSLSLRGGGPVTPATLGAATISLNQCGGLTKLGSGTLTLSGAGSFTGGTVVSNGTLKVGVADALLPGSSVMLAENTIFDLNGLTVTNMVDGAGMVVNGTLYGGFSPADIDAVGTQSITLGAQSAVAGKYLLDVNTDGTCDHLTLNGNVDLSNVQLEIVDTDKLDRKQKYVIASVPGEVQGMFEAVNLPDAKWRVKLIGNSVWLFYSDGLQLMIR